MRGEANRQNIGRSGARRAAYSSAESIAPSCAANITLGIIGEGMDGHVMAVSATAPVPLSVNVCSDPPQDI